MKTKLILFLMPVLFIFPAMGFKDKASPCTFLLIKNSLIPREPLPNLRDGSDEEDNLRNDDSDGEYSEDTDPPTKPQRRRLSGTLIHSLAAQFLSPDGVITCLNRKNIALTQDTEQRLRDGFCEPKCYSTEYWGQLLADSTTRQLIAVVYLSLTDETSQSTEALEETFSTLAQRFPNPIQQTCFPAWILNELGEFSAS